MTDRQVILESRIEEIVEAPAVTAASGVTGMDMRMTENQGGNMIDLGRRGFLETSAGLLIPALVKPAAKVFDLGRSRPSRPKVYRTARSGRWNDPATWEGGSVPPGRDDDRFIVGAVHSLHIDRGSVPLSGQLSVETSDFVYVGDLMPISVDGLRRVYNTGKGSSPIHFFNGFATGTAAVTILGVAPPPIW